MTEQKLILRVKERSDVATVQSLTLKMAFEGACPELSEGDEVTITMDSRSRASKEFATLKAGDKIAVLVKDSKEW
jgi:hypothetical protein